MPLNGLSFSWLESTFSSAFYALYKLTLNQNLTIAFSSTRMCISYEFQRYIPLVTAYVFILLFEHESIHPTLFNVGASADCSIAIKPKNGVSPNLALFVLPLTLYFLVTHQASVAKRFMFGLHTITGNSTNLLARRPFFVFWFMGQIHRFVLSGFFDIYIS